jgi:hypothetical protein
MVPYLVGGVAMVLALFIAAAVLFLLAAVAAFIVPLAGLKLKLGWLGLCLATLAHIWPKLVA